jgi:hypothetical protein
LCHIIRIVLRTVLDAFPSFLIFLNEQAFSHRMCLGL